MVSLQTVVGRNITDSNQISKPRDGVIGSTEIRMSVRRDLFASKELDATDSLQSTTPNDQSLLAQVVFIATGTSPNIKNINVETSASPRRHPIIMPSPAKKEKLSPLKIKSEILIHSSPGSVKSGKKISPRNTPSGRKKYVQTNKLTNYFTPSPKKLKVERSNAPEIIDISDDSNESEELQISAMKESEANGINLLDESKNTSVVNISDTIEISSVESDEDCQFVSHCEPGASVIRIAPHALKKGQCNTKAAKASSLKKETTVGNMDTSTIKLDDSDVQFVSESAPWSVRETTETLEKQKESPVSSSPKPKAFPSPMCKASRSSTENAVPPQPAEAGKNLLELESSTLLGPRHNMRPVVTLCDVMDTYLMKTASDVKHNEVLNEGEGLEFLADTGENGRERLSIPQLCCYFRRRQLDKKDIGERLQVVYSPSAASYDAWSLSDDEVDMVSAVIKHKEWYLALADCLDLIDDCTYLPSYILQHVMHNALHSHNDACVNQSLAVLHKARILHPAYADDMQEHYWQLLTDTYVMKSATYPRSNVPILDELLELASVLSKTRDNCTASKVDTNWPENAKDQQLEAMARAWEANNVFATLSWPVKMKRVCMLLEHVVAILEEDMVGAVQQGRASIVAQLFWPDRARRNIGISNAKCREVFQLLRLTLDMPVNMFLLRLVSVMAEAVHLAAGNAGEDCDPSTNTKCAEFARSVFLVTSSACSELPILTARLKPHWLQALIADLAEPTARLE